MKCKGCQYSLWNLRSRTCPECGRGFTPSEYSFRPGTIRFCCPHCAQHYFGTDKDGLLEPRAFTCVKCGQGVTLEEMVLLPVEGLSEAQTSGEIMPWLERPRIGFWRGWWGTVTRAMLSPGRLLDLTPPDSGVGPALKFACFSQAVFGLTGFMGILCGAMVIGALVGAAGGAMSFGLALIVGFFVGFIIVILSTLLVVTLWSLATHGVLRLTGKTEYRLDRTIQAIAYSSGANALTGIPCIGAYFSSILSIWWLVSAVLAVRTAQKVSGWRASMAVLGPPLLLAGVIVAAYSVGMYFVLQQAQAAGTAGGGSFWNASPQASQLERRNQTHAALVHSELKNYAMVHDTWPLTGFHLIVENSIDPSAFVYETFDRDASTVKIEGMSLLAFQVMNTEGQTQVLEAAAGNVPSNLVAARFGDTVFTFYGVTPDDIDPRLWLHVLCPAGDPATVRMIALQVGGFMILQGEERLKALAAQNLIRVELGLEPLPDPATIEGYYEKP